MCKLARPKPLTRGVYALGLGMWSTAVDHSFDFAYQGDAVANSVSATPSLSAPRSAPSTLCLSIIKVGIDPFTILSLSGCSHKAKTFLARPDRWLFHLSFGIENGRKKIVCTSLIIFNGNRQAGPDRSTAEIYKTSVCIDCFLSAPYTYHLLLLEVRGDFVLFCSEQRCPTAKRLVCWLPG